MDSTDHLETHWSGRTGPSRSWRVFGRETGRAHWIGTMRSDPPAGAPCMRGRASISASRGKGTRAGDRARGLASRVRGRLLSLRQARRVAGPLRRRASRSRDQLPSLRQVRSPPPPAAAPFVAFLHLLLIQRSLHVVFNVARNGPRAAQEPAKADLVASRKHHLVNCGGVPVCGKQQNAALLAEQCSSR